MRPIGKLLLRMMAELSRILSDVIDGKETAPSRRVRQVWTVHESALAKAESDAEAAEKFGDE